MPLFIRWDDLTDKLVGRTARGERPSVRWPRELTVFKEAYNRGKTSLVMLSAGGLLGAAAMTAAILALVARPLIIAGLLGNASVAVILSTGSVGLLLALVCALLYGTTSWSLGARHRRLPRRERALRGSIRPAERAGAITLRSCGARTTDTISELVESLYSEDPHLDLRSAAFLTMGAMPAWLKEWTWPGRRMGTRFDGEPYTVERAGVDYLELMRKIEQNPQAYMWETWSFRGKSLPGIDCRLPDPLKDAVVEIVLLFSSLPDSGEAPDEETEAAVLYTINRLATIDGESFTEVVHRLHEEAEDEKKAAEDKRKADYNSEIRRTLYAANIALDAKADAKTDERYESIQRGMKRLSKISEESGCAAESAASQLAEAASITK